MKAVKNTGWYAAGLVLAIGLAACAAPGQVGVKTPQSGGSGYPPVIETTPEQQQQAEAAWRAFLAEHQLPETKFEAEPVLNTPRALPLNVANRIKLSSKDGPLDELAAKEALRRFIDGHAALLSGGREAAVPLKDLSLVTFSADGLMYRAVYLQRSFPYPLVNGYGELTLALSKTGMLLQLSSRLVPPMELPASPTVEVKDLPDRFLGRSFTYSNIAGQPMSYKVANFDEVVIKDLVVYPKLTGNRLSLHLAYPVEVGRGMTWTVYVDAVTGTELEVRQNFAT